jgi:hypothetical protein
VHNLRDLREISGQPYSFLFLYESEIKSAQRESCGRNEAAQAARAQLRRIIIKHLREDTTLLEQTVDMLQGKQTIPNNLRESIAKILKVDTSSDKGVSPEFISGHCELSGDPDGILSEWKIHGAPQGITNEITATGIFPPVAPAYSTRDPLQDIASDPRGWINYKSAEESPDTISGILQNMKKKNGLSHAQPGQKWSTYYVPTKSHSASSPASVALGRQLEFTKANGSSSREYWT